MKTNRSKPYPVLVRLITIFLPVLFLMFVSVANAQESGFWYEGKVTGGPWFGKQNRIEINSVEYLIMPEIGVWLNKSAVPSAKGKKQQELLRKFVRGTKVRFKANGNYLFQIMFYK